MDPRLLGIIGILFLGIGGFSFVLAQKNMRYARMQGNPGVWHKNLALMTSIEYILLGVIIFLNLSNNWIPAQLRVIRDIFFAIILLLTVVFLFRVVFLGFKQPRQPRRTQSTPQSVANAEVTNINTQSSAEKNAEQQRKRERRQKAAEARRRRAGRA